MRKAVCLLVGVMWWSAAGRAAPYQSQFGQMPDRLWIGADLWANPMEDWQVHGGRLECTTAAPDRNVHVLTHQLSGRTAPFSTSVRLGRITGTRGAAGFLVGVHDPLNDYRGNLFFGHGTKAFITTGGKLILDGKTASLTGTPALTDVMLRLAAAPAKGQYLLTLTATATGSGQTLGELQTTVPPDFLVGNLALVQNPKGTPSKANARFWFSNWQIGGAKVDDHPEQTFGPILFSMYTLSNSRTADGFIMKITAQMPPMGELDSHEVRLEANQGDGWRTLGTQAIDADSRTATFRVAHWPADRDVPYRLHYALKTADGPSADCQWAGTIHKDPADHPLVVPGFTGHFYRGFPYGPVIRNATALKPDLLFFSGDQIYEPNGGFGIIRQPADRAILNYLRKWYLFGWVWRDLLRDVPAICLPDDHDVFHGNLWGEGGAPSQGKSMSSTGGYAEPIRMVNVVHRTNCSHQPDPYDATPALRGLTVYYTDMVYGRVSFAILADRQFKSGPEMVKTDGRRGDWVKSPNFDVASLDKPGLKLLGDRQLEFLEHWAGDWRGADMKMVLSQTVFANAATHHGSADNYLQADLDSGGWPQTGRNRAIRAMRKGYPLHYDGDQHLATVLQYGVDAPRDSNWSFCTPGVSNLYERWWHPDRVHRPYTDRPPAGLPDTGEYRDGFGNMIYMAAVANPKATGAGTPNRYQWAEARASGFANVVIDRMKRTYTCECYRFLVDLTQGDRSDQFAGWPVTIRQRDNYGRKAVGYLAEVAAKDIPQPVLQVFDQETGELVYSLRLTTNHVKPWVFKEGRYTVKLGDPDTDRWQVVKDQTVQQRTTP